jgi:diacylglycerol kinase (ATP)
VKSQRYLARLGFAFAGIGTVWRREKSFRAQCWLGLVGAAMTAALRPGWVWAALIALAMGLVFALEMINAALEYLIDRVHPDIHDEIKHAKDAAAGAVLLASMFGSLVVAAMLLDWLLGD